MRGHFVLKSGGTANFSPRALLFSYAWGFFIELEIRYQGLKWELYDGGARKEQRTNTEKTNKIKGRK